MQSPEDGSPKFFAFKNPEKYQGIRGWLLLFAVSLVFLNPLLALYSLGVLVFSNRQLNPVFRYYPGLFTIALIESLIALGLVAFGAYAGILLWRKVPGAVYVIKKYLAAVLIYGILLAISEFTLAVQYNLPPAVLLQSMLRVVGIAFYYLLWMSFLRNSKRVEVNFGKEAANYQPLKWLGF